jgi:hypothetical protein
MIQKPTRTPKDAIFRLHHQLNVNHDAIVFWYIKCSLVRMSMLVKDESNNCIVSRPLQLASIPSHLFAPFTLNFGLDFIAFHERLVWLQFWCNL